VPAIRVIPCLDMDGRRGVVLKGVNFMGLREVGDPVEMAVAYEEEGADEIAILDITATPEDRGTFVEAVRRVAEAVTIPVLVGGGVKTLRDAEALFKAGADKVSINTAAVKNPGLIREMAEVFGSQSTVVAIDAKRAGGRYEVYVRGGREPTGLDAVEWAKKAVEARRGGDTPNLHRPRRHQAGLRHGAHCARGAGRGRARDSVRRRGGPGALLRGSQGGRRRGTGGLPLPLPPARHTAGQAVPMGGRRRGAAMRGLPRDAVKAVEPIIDDVAARGLDAALEYSRRLDGAAPEKPLIEPRPGGDPEVVTAASKPPRPWRLSTEGSSPAAPQITTAASSGWCGGPPYAG